MEEGDNEDNEKKRQFVKKLRAAGGLLQFLLSLIPLSLKNPKRKAAKNIVIKRNPHNPNKRHQSFAAPTACTACACGLAYNRDPQPLLPQTKHTTR